MTAMLKRERAVFCLFAILLAVAALEVPVACAQEAAAETAIPAIVAEQVIAWTASDAARYAEHLWPEASFTKARRPVVD